MSSVRASTLLLTYNQESFVKQALDSLLNQDYENLEIIVSDDASTDNTWNLIKIISEKYRGPKKITLNQNRENLGILANYYTAFNLSTGDLIFTAAGDDISTTNRCAQTIAHWTNLNKIPDLIAADGLDMATDGTIIGPKFTEELREWDLHQWASRRPFVFGASHMMTRRLVGLRVLSAKLPYEDQNFVARALMMGGACRLALPLVKHRRGGVSQSKKAWSFEYKKARFIESARAALLERQEILLDAALLGVSEIEAYFDEQFLLNSFIIELLSEEKFIEQLKITKKHASVPLRKRLKYLSFAFREKSNLHFNQSKTNTEKP